MASGIWLVCSACDLRHSVRPDGLCPRCGAPTLPPPSDAPGAAVRPPPPPPILKAGAGGRVVGMRTAGGVFVLVALLFGLFGPVRDTAPGMLPMAPAAGVLVVLLLGLWLLRGSDVARRLAWVLAALALAAAIALCAAAPTRSEGVVLGSLGGAALLLLVGDVGPRRIAVALLVLAAGLAAAVVGLWGAPPASRKLLPRLFGPAAPGLPTSRAGDAGRRGP